MATKRTRNALATLLRQALAREAAATGAPRLEDLQVGDRVVWLVQRAGRVDRQAGVVTGFLPPTVHPTQRVVIQCDGWDRQVRVAPSELELAR